MKYGAAAFFFILFFSSCQQNTEDEMAPQITRFDVSDDDFEVGETVSITVGASDNEELGQVRLRIREAFAKSFGFWRILRVDDVSGTSFRKTYNFTVPDTALAGYYEIAFQASDERGNGSKDSLRYINIIQTEEGPRLVDFATDPPLVDGTLFLLSGDSLTFSGTAIDNINLSTVTISLAPETGSNIENLLYQISDSLTSWSFSAFADTIFADYTERIPSRLLIKIQDSEGHQSRTEYPVVYQP